MSSEPENMSAVAPRPPLSAWRRLVERLFPTEPYRPVEDGEKRFNVAVRLTFRDRLRLLASGWIYIQTRIYESKPGQGQVQLDILPPGQHWLRGFAANARRFPLR